MEMSVVKRQTAMTAKLLSSIRNNYKLTELNVSSPKTDQQMHVLKVNIH